MSGMMGGKGYYNGDNGYSKGKVRLEEKLIVSTRVEYVLKVMLLSIIREKVA